MVPTGPASDSDSSKDAGVLVDVDRKSVLETSLQEVSALMLGSEGSQSAFGILRGETNDRCHCVHTHVLTTDDS